ncbi:MAG: hypothetical protein GC160_13330 [Acidobacteria bacterium]|nr:hypothetical protein [Acidobacteriota bacterium]
MNATEWAAVVNRTVEAQIERLIGFLPDLAAALAIILVGWALALLARGLVRRIATLIVGRLSQRAELQRGLEQGGMRTRLPALVGYVAFWAVLLLFIAAGVEQLGVTAVSLLLSQAAYYLPRLLVGVLIVAAGMVFGDFAAQWASVAMSPIGVVQSQALGRALQVLVVAIAVVVAADQVGIQSTFLMLAFSIALLVSMGGVALAFAIGCGPIVGNVVAAHYVAKRLERGQRARVGESEGSISEITATFVVLKTDHGETLVPARRFMEEPADIGPGAVERPGAEQ